MRLTPRALVVSLALTSPAPAQSGPVQYRLDLSNASQQLIDASITLHGITTDTVDLHLPVWRPGLYLVLDQSGSIRDVAAAASNTSLPITKSDKATWRVTTQGHSSITVSYRVWAGGGGLENRTRHADDTHAFISPSAVLMYSPAWRALPVEVRIDAPADWAIATGLDASPADPSLIKAPDYDRLVDSPIEVGIHDTITFLASGTPHHIILWTGEPATAADAQLPAGHFKNSDRFAKLAGDFEKIALAQESIFGKLPYDRYVFLLHCYPAGRGGTEHWNSTVMQFTPDVFASDDSYRKLLALTAHELFHTWNVKRFRPVGLTPYGYQRENYTDLLWLAEGTTTYYEDVTLTRAGLKTPDGYFKELAESIDNHRRRPGSRVQSLTDSSFDAWVKHNRRTPDAPNSTVSFYDKGALASFLLDMEIRSRTGGDKSLDDLMRSLHRRFPTPDRGYSSEDVKTALNGIAGDFSAFFADVIEGTSDLDFETALAVVGLKLEREQKKPDVADDPSATPPDTEKPDLGITTRDQSGLLALDTVLSDSPAAAAGLLPGDLISAIDGRRVAPSSWDKALDQHQPGQTIRITYFRHDAQRETTAMLAARPAAKLKIIRDPAATDQQQAQYAQWLGVAWPPLKIKDAPLPAE